MEGTILAVLASAIIITVTLTLNIMYRDELFIMGVNFIYNYQTNHQSSSITVVQNIISVLGNTFFVIALLAIVHLVFKRKLATLVYISYIVANAYLISVLKQAFQDPRPFFYDSRIQALEWSCSKSFGFPSGHSWIAILLYQPIISDLIGTKGLKKILLVLLVLTGSLIPLSRLYLGSHTSDQVLCGLIFSIASVVLYRFWLQQKLYSLMNNSLDGGSRIKIFILTTIFLVLSMVAPFTLYQINNRYRELNSVYINLIRTACSKNYTQVDLETDAAVAGALIMLPVGIIYGLLLSGWLKFRRNFESFDKEIIRNRFKAFMAGKWTFDSSFCNVAKYILVYAIFGGILLGGIGLGASSAVKDMYGEYFLQTLGFGLFGLSLSSFIPLALVKWEAIKLIESRESVSKNVMQQIRQSIQMIQSKS